MIHRGVVGVGSVGARAPTDFRKALIITQMNLLENQKIEYGEPTDENS